MLTRPSVALECILNEVSSLSEESIPLEKSLNRHLSQDIFAPISLPPFDNSAMDGFALRATDTSSASISSPIALKIVKTLFAGNASESPVQKMESVRIMTGAPLPSGADVVLPFEEAEEKERFCMVSKPLMVGKHIRRKGEDVEKSQLVFTKGERLDSKKASLLAAMGFSEVSVVCQPRVVLFSTGDELQSLGSPLKFGKIYDSNSTAIALALQELEIDAKHISTAHDRLEDLENAFQEASEAEVILTMGAVSAGDLDLIPQLLKKIGAQTLFHKLAIKPGKPLLFARWGKRLIFCLPGNPVSAWVTFDRFVRPALLKMMGAASLFRKRSVAFATETIQATKGKEDYLQAHVEWKDEKFFASLAGKQGSAQLSTLAKSNALLIIPESISQIHEGERVIFEFLRDSL